MHRIKLTISLLTLSISLTPSVFAASFESFEHAGQLYQALRLGKTLRVAPAEITSKLEKAAGSEEPNCAEVRRVLNHLEPTRQICLQNPGSSVCRTLGVRFRFVVEGRANEDMNVDRRMVHSWSISPPRPLASIPASLARAAAERFAVSADSVEIDVLSGATMNAMNASPPSISFAEEALSPRYESVIRLAPNIWARNGSNDLVTQNLAIACDLREGNAQFTARGEVPTTRTESVPEGQINILWDAYKYLSRFAADAYGEQNPLLQGVVIGFHIAKALPENTPLEGLFAPEEIFRRMYQAQESTPRIRHFTSQQVMRSSIYPDQFFSGAFQPIWRLQ